MRAPPLPFQLPPLKLLPHKLLPFKLLPFSVLFVACGEAGPGPVDRIELLERRVAELEAENRTLKIQAQQAETVANASLAAASQVTVPGAGADASHTPGQGLSLRGLELRVQDLERRLVDSQTTSPVGPSGPATVGLPVVEVDPQTGAMVPVLDEAATVSCAHSFIDGVRTAEMAFDAAFDEFSEDLERIGWAPDPAKGCAAYVAVAVEAEQFDVRVLAVITRGHGRGRQFEGRLHHAPREIARLDETGIATFLAGHAWAGSAR